MDLMEEIKNTLEQGELYRNPDLDTYFLSQKIGVSEKVCEKCIRENTGLPVFAFLNEYRIEKIRVLLDKEIIFQKPAFYFSISGFSSKSTFDRYFNRIVGINIQKYIKVVKKTEVGEWR